MSKQHAPAILLRYISLVFGFIALLLPFGLQVPSAFAASPSFVRIIHASPDVGTADIFVDGTKFLSSMPFGTVTDYAQLPDGPHKVQIALIGKGPGAAVITQTLNVQSGVAYTVAAIGTNSTGLSLDVIQDDNQIVTGMAKIRIYHLSPSMGTVSIKDGSNTVINDLSYPKASDYLSLHAGSYTFNVIGNQSNVNLPVAANLATNTVTSVFAIGLINGTPKFQFVASQVAGTPGVPGTGSDPNAQPVSSQPFPPLSPWLLGIVALVAIGSGITTQRVLTAREKK